jgi:hypothetical protein
VFTVNQAGGCSYGLSLSSQTVGASGGAVTVAVTASAGCAWTASSQAPWLTISSGGSGTGSSPVQIDVQPNTGAARTGTALIAGQTFTVLQDSGCLFVVSPENVPAPAGGGAARVEVAAAASCTWTAVNPAAWIGITGSAGGTGNGAVDLSFAANTGPARSGAVTVAGRTVTVTQDSGCTFSLSATSQTMPGSGGVGTVSVSTSGGRLWSALCGVPWITITDGVSGSGAGTLQFAVEPNATGARALDSSPSPILRSLSTSSRGQISILRVTVNRWAACDQYRRGQISNLSNHQLPISSSRRIQASSGCRRRWFRKIEI